MLPSLTFALNVYDVIYSTIIVYHKAYCFTTFDIRDRILKILKNIKLDNKDIKEKLYKTVCILFRRTSPIIIQFYKLRFPDRHNNQ